MALLVACACSEREERRAPQARQPEAAHQRRIRLVKETLQAEYPEGLDPDKTNEAAGQLWTKWHYDMKEAYRESERHRAFVHVATTVTEDVDPLRVEVFAEINDNIDEPSSIERARWVYSRRDRTRAAQLRALVEGRWKKEVGK